MATASLLLCLLTATPAEDIDRGIRLYDEGDFAGARRVLSEALSSEAIEEPARSAARIHLAASHYALNQRAEAKAELVRLFIADPTATLDPAKFVPELIALAEEARGEAAEELSKKRAEPIPEPPPERPPPPVLPPPEPPPALRPGRPFSARLLIPFGVGQFENGDTAKGTALLVTEALCLTIAATSLVALESMKREGVPLRTGGFYPAEIGTARLVHGAYLGGAWLGAALMIGGVIEAILSRPSETVALSWGPGPSAEWTFSRTGPRDRE